MSTAVRIYHNSRCSKSRAALTLLQEHGCQCEVVNYLDTPPSIEELTVLLEQLGMTARELMRKSEPEYQELGLSEPTLSETALITAMTEHPRLIERPIVVANGKAALGRPPESVLAIL
ncbi:arsenate reductase (glutaredoxin) [Dyella tabacisoli]|uniref:Arsenate reductase n=1 Tax=Dyella tabacisoli TaxID=2282381 RepID=A0A369URM7_9GAMM|nr:arsenate reductase (glutaredoxin) [Dyella tabacisoli]RDD83171.1 arsenate reductase (glutaredoxin) [Dyella tabacisoli]